MERRGAGAGGQRARDAARAGPAVRPDRRGALAVGDEAAAARTRADSGGADGPLRTARHGRGGGLRPRPGAHRTELRSHFRFRFRFRSRDGSPPGFHFQIRVRVRIHVWPPLRCRGGSGDPCGDRGGGPTPPRTPGPRGHGPPHRTATAPHPLPADPGPGMGPSTIASSGPGGCRGLRDSCRCGGRFRTRALFRSHALCRSGGLCRPRETRRRGARCAPCRPGGLCGSGGLSCPRGPCRRGESHALCGSAESHALWRSGEARGRGVRWAPCRVGGACGSGGFC